MLSKLALGLFFLTLNLSAQTDSLDLRFVSNLEKEFFLNSVRDSINIDYIAGLTVIDSSCTLKRIEKYSSRINSVINTLPLEKQKKGKKEKKRIKEIYDIIHETFFKKYTLEAYFTDIFELGHYNCVTASALYAYVFEKINIPYTIKEEPGHVYIIAYPNVYDIYLETTVPGEYGFYIPEEDTIREIVDELVAMKLVSIDELSAKGYSQTYQEYYFDENYLSLKNLIGAQYYNRAVFAIAEEDYEEGYFNLEKAKFFYTTELSEYLTKEVLYLLVVQKEYDNIEDVAFLIKSLDVLEFKKDYTEDNLKGLLYKIANNDSNDVEFLDGVLQRFSSIKESRVKNIALEYINLFVSQHYARNNNLDKAIKYANGVLKIDDDNKNARELIVWSVQKKVALLPLSESSLGKVDEYFKVYPFLEGNVVMNTMKILIYARWAQFNFKKHNITKANDYLKKMEGVYKVNPNVQVSPEMFCEVYLSAGRYYYGKLNLEMSEKLLRKGLVFNPDHIDLNRVLNYVLEDIQ